jgi:hypothetical protein
MKKLVLATLMAGLIPMIAVAQGTVNFASANANQIVVTSLTPITPVGAGFSAALYWGPLGSAEGAVIQLGATTAPFAGNGFIAGGVRTTGAGTAPGAQGTFQVRAWDGGFATYEQAFAAASGLLGKTPLFNNNTGDPGATPPGTPAPLAGWTAPLLVEAVPEPSMIALAGLGVASLLIFRRRK